jgi:hypothetical protein
MQRATFSVSHQLQGYIFHKMHETYKTLRHCLFHLHSSGVPNSLSGNRGHSFRLRQPLWFVPHFRKVFSMLLIHFWRLLLTCKNQPSECEPIINQSLTIFYFYLLLAYFVQVTIHFPLCYTLSSRRSLASWVYPS